VMGAMVFSEFQDFRISGSQDFGISGFRDFGIRKIFPPPSAHPQILKSSDPEILRS